MSVIVHLTLIAFPTGMQYCCSTARRAKQLRQPKTKLKPSCQAAVRRIPAKALMILLSGENTLYRAANCLPKWFARQMTVLAVVCRAYHWCVKRCPQLSPIYIYIYICCYAASVHRQTSISDTPVTTGWLQ